MSGKIQKALAEKGVSGRIDELRKAAIDQYYRSVAGSGKSYRQAPGCRRFLHAGGPGPRVKALLVAAVAAAGIAAGLGSAALLAGEPAGLTPSAIEEGGSPRLGSASAPITIVEYGDYQCTYCYRFHQDTLPQIARYVEGGQVSLVFQDFPLNGEDSVLAAQASRCAGEQGLYWPYHDELYENWGGERTGWVTREALSSFASRVGAQEAAFESCLDEGRHRAAVLEAYERGARMGIDATPSFLIFDGQSVVKVRGNQPAEVFHRVLQGLGQT